VLSDGTSCKESHLCEATAVQGWADEYVVTARYVCLGA